MPRQVLKRNILTDSGASGGGKEGRRRFHLLRYSHIFASLVHDILEVKFLREAAACPLTVCQFHLLKLLSLNGGYQITAVAELLGVSPPAASKSINKLAEQGLIVRTASTGDRRATLLSASVKGRRLVRKYEGLQADHLAPVFEEFGPEELERFAELLERFSLSLIDQEDTGTGQCLRCSAHCAEQCAVAQARRGCPCQKSRANHDSDDGDRARARLPAQRRAGRPPHR